jgi:nicotinate-nucleotide adenylyltransferase
MTRTRPRNQSSRGSRALRVGVFGGTFNPPHLGHLICAHEARWQLELDSVLIVPVGEASHKEIEMDAGREERYALCRLAVAAEEGLAASQVEIAREGPSYTVDTLRELREQSPSDDFCFIVGADEAAVLGTWHEPAEVLRLAALGVAEREGVGEAEVLAAVREVGDVGRVSFFSMPRIDVSSTLVRERVAAGLPFRHLVPLAVADFIEEAGLYAGERAAAGRPTV